MKLHSRCLLAGGLLAVLLAGSVAPYDKLDQDLVRILAGME